MEGAFAAASRAGSNNMMATMYDLGSPRTVLDTFVTGPLSTKLCETHTEGRAGNYCEGIGRIGAGGGGMDLAACAAEDHGTLFSDLSGTRSGETAHDKTQHGAGGADRGNEAECQDN